MRRFLTAILPVLLVAASAPAQAVNEGEVFSRGLFVPMTVLHDGKKSGTDLVVNYSVVYSGGKWTASWEEVKIFQDRMAKRTVLLPATWSPASGDVKNVVVRADSASFDLVMGHADAIVVVGKGDNLSGEQPDVRVRLLYFDGSSKKNILEEWVLTDRIILPFKEVYRSGDALPERRKEKR